MSGYWVFPLTVRESLRQEHNKILWTLQLNRKSDSRLFSSFTIGGGYKPRGAGSEKSSN